MFIPPYICPFLYVSLHLYVSLYLCPFLCLSFYVYWKEYGCKKCMDKKDFNTAEVKINCKELSMILTRKSCIQLGNISKKARLQL